MKKIALILLSSFIILSVGAQAPVGDCLGAIPVCQPIYEEDQSPTGGGDVLEINGDFNCMLVENNSIWYTFTVNQSGDFGFLLTPNDPDDDYDWALFDITNANCEDLFEEESLIVSCNSAGGTGCHGPTGANGGSNFNNQGYGCNFPDPDYVSGFSPFNDFVPVQEGNTYVLCVSNWTGSINGYVIDFGLSSDIGIFDEVQPEVDSYSSASECSSEIDVVFSEFIQCETIDASNFELTGPGGPYDLILSSVNCNAGGNFAKEFTIVIDPPISEGGDFTLMLNVPTSDDVLDLCNNPSLESAYTFTQSNPLPTFDFGPDTTLCSGESIILDPGINGANYQWQDGSGGSTFEVTSPGTYSLTISDDCFSREDEIMVGFYEPISTTLTDGELCEGETLILDATSLNATYLWQDGSTEPTLQITEPGNFSVTVTNPCETVVLSAQFEIAVAAPSIELGSDTLLCPDESILLEVFGQNAVYSWSTGSSDSRLLVEEAGIYSVTVTNECGEAIDDISVGFRPPITLAFPNDTFLCPGEQIVVFADAQNAIGLQWQDGSQGATFRIEEPGIYSLSAFNNCETVTASMEVTECVICDVFVPNAFSPNDDGINDIFQPLSDCPFEEFNLRIFNRWGAQLYESDDPSEGWDGTRNDRPLNPETYVWFLEYTVVEDGKPREEIISGDVQLVR